MHKDYIRFWVWNHKKKKQKKTQLWPSRILESGEGARKQQKMSL